MGMESQKVINEMKEAKKEKDVYQCLRCGNIIKEEENHCSNSKCDGNKIKMKKPPSSPKGPQGFLY